MRHLVTFLILGACLMTVQNSVLQDKVFLFQKPDGNDSKTVLVVTWAFEEDDEKAVGCEIFTDPQLIEEVVKASSNNELVRTPSEKEMKDIIEECTEISKRKRRDTVSSWRRGDSRGRRRINFGSRDKSDKSEETRGDSSEENSEDGAATQGYNSLPVIFPGTKWCGAGDLAKNYDDLGFHRDTDMCCRDHDLCNDTLAPGESKKGLKNKSTFTKLSCKCDDDFYECLENVNSLTSNTVGNAYFNVLRRECYALDYPFTKKCKKYRTFLKITCLEYERDTKAEKEYQWVKAKTYKKIPIPFIDVSLP